MFLKTLGPNGTRIIMVSWKTGSRKSLAKVSARNLFLPAFGATRRILGAILDPAGFQGGSKNHVFGYHVGKMTKKGCPKTRPEKYQNLIENLFQNERVWEVNMSVSLGTCCKIKVFGVSWNIEKIDAKRDPKSDQNRNQKRSEIIFLRFLGVLGEAEI